MGNFRPLSQTKYINDANLLTYWKLEDTSDSKGSMTLTNQGTTTFTSGKFDNAANFGVTNTTKCLYASQTSNTTFTVSFWVNYSAWNAGQALIDKYPSGGWRINGGTTWNGLLLSFDATNWVLSFTPTIGQWYHIVMTFNNSTGTALTYIDGILRDTKTGLTLTDSTANITLGVANNLTTYFLSGLLDDTAIFSRVLSAAEVADLYQSMTLGEYNGSGSGITKALYHLNGSSADSSGNGNNGTDTAITYVNGKFGKSAQFATGRKIQTANSTALDCNNITVSAWVYFTGTNAQQSRIAERDSDDRLWILSTGTSDTAITFTAWNSFGTIYQANAGQTNLSQNEWHHVVATWDGSFIKRYVDGSPYGTNLAVSGSLRGGTEPLSIGNDTTGINRYLAGNIDEVIIENVAWSAEKVKKYYTFSRGRFGIV